MPFTEEEIATWHRERRDASDKVDGDRRQDAERARRANAIAVCIHCHNPFGFGEGIITEDVEMCYICLD